MRDRDARFLAANLIIALPAMSAAAAAAQKAFAAFYAKCNAGAAPVLAKWRAGGRTKMSGMHNISP